jgi:SAM-dependent methyltransferase
LLRERLKNILRGPRPTEEVGSPAADASRPRLTLKSAEKEVAYTRGSRGLEQFFAFFKDQAGLTILDLGGAYQENINFITNLGHRFYSEDFVRIFHETFATDPNDQSNPGQIEFFLRQSLDYTDEQFDGVLAWDVLEYMTPPLLTATVDRLLRILKPKGYLLAFFHSTDRVDTVPCYTFRIQDFHTLQVNEQDARTPPQLFNNRSLEKLFQKFESVKFFLTRERLREVIARK